MFTRLARLFPALAAFVLAILFLFIPPFINILSHATEVSAAPVLQEVPTLDTTSESIAEVAVALTTNQFQIEAGAIVTYTVVITNTTNEAIGKMVLSSTLPPSTNFVANSKSTVIYNPQFNSITWEAGDVPPDTILTTTYQVQVDSAATDGFLVAQVELTSPDLTETLEGWEVNAVGQIPSNEMWMTPEGGLLQSENNPVSIIVNSDGITEALYFEIGDSSIQTTPNYIWSAFDLTATNKNDDVVTTFPTSLTIAVNISDYMTAALEAGGTPSLYWFNESTTAWELVPSTMYWGTGRLEAKVDHFSTFGFGSSTQPSYGAQHLPTIDGFSNNEWSGNSQVNYPLVLPPAPGNIPFGLALTYSSEGVNSLLGMERDTAYDQIDEYQRQASTIGWGWNLSGLGQINRNLSDQRLFANFAGGNFEMMQTVEGWQTEPQSFVRIEAPSNTTRFKIFTQDGVTYTFGSDNWGNGVAYSFELGCQYPLEKTLREAHLTEIEDAYGNRIYITYAAETRNWSNGCGNSGDYIRAIRPTEINYYPAASGGVSTVKITLKYSNTFRTDDETSVVHATTPEVQTFWSNYNLWGIDVQINEGGWQSSRHYKLVQDATSGGESLLVLKYIEDYGNDGAYGTRLPSYEFSYVRYDSRWKNTTLLDRARNGYGGIVKYDYALHTNINIRGCPNTATQSWFKADRYYVRFMHVGDGMTASYGTPTTNTIQLTPTNAFAHGENPGAGCPTDFQFGGFGQVQRDVKRGSTTYTRTITKYYTGAGDEVSSAAGLMFEQKRLDPTNNNYDLGKLEASHVIGSAYYTDWVYKQWERQIITGTTGTVMRYQTNFAYEMSHQKNQQLGRVTRATEYINDAPIRTQVFSFTRSYTDMPFVVRLSQQQLFVGTGGGVCQGETRYYYDGSNTLGALLTRGELDKTSVSTQNVAATNNCDRNTVTMYTLFDYDSYGRQNKITDARGGVTDVTYDTVLHVYPRFIDKPNVNGYRPTVEYIWDYKIGQVRFEKDVDNNVQTEYQYDQWGRAVNIFAPLGGWTQISYFDNAPNNPAIVLPYKVQTRTNTSTTPHQIYNIAYIDGLGRELETKSTYVNPANAVEHVVGHTFYHPLGGVAMTYAPEPFAGTAGGSHGYIMPSSWANPYTSSVTYDALGRPKTETAADSSTTIHTYDVKELYAVPMTTHHVNVANQNRTLSYTDALGRLRGIEERNASDGVYSLTRYDYDIADRLTDVYDHFGNHTEVDYDLAGRKTRMDDPDMGEWLYRYDGLGTLKAQVDAASNGVCFNYDLLGRPVSKIVYDNTTIGTIFNSTDPNAACPLTGVTITENVSNLYDSGSYGKGRLYSITDVSGDSTIYTYDARGRVTTELETIRFAATNHIFKTSFEYDILDRVRKITYPADTNGTNTNGEQVHYDYDSQRQLNLTGVRLIAGGVTTNLATNMTYNHYGQMNTMMYGTVPALQQKYDYHPLNGTQGESLGRVNHMYLGTVDGQGNNLANKWILNYTYDAVGNIDRIGSYRDLTEFQYQHFSYDFLNRLTHAYTEFSSANGAYDEYYGYNQIGNMTSKAGVAYTYPTSGSARPHAVSSLNNGKSYTYDAVGNMQTRSTSGVVDNTFSYDNENRLKQILVGDQASVNYIADYGYNGQGERVYAYSDGKRTLYPNSYIELQLNTGGIGSVGTWTKYYFAGTQRIAMKQGSTLYYTVNDHLGSTSLVLNTNGTVYSEQRYKPYGETRWTNYATTPTRRQFTGQINDIGTGLYFYNARYYDPALGRFTQADTIVPEPGNPQSLNRFSYTLNNPVKYVDPSGHFTEDAIIAHLKQEYGQEWEYYFQLWQSDEAWWQMLLLAEGGDYLVGGYDYFEGGGSGALFFYQFDGVGQDVLNGINYVTSQGSIAHGVIQDLGLEQLRNGSKTIAVPNLPGTGAGLRSVTEQYEWLGLLREGNATFGFAARAGSTFGSFEWNPDLLWGANMVTGGATIFVEAALGIPILPALVNGVVIGGKVQPEILAALHISEADVKLVYSYEGRTYEGWITRIGRNRGITWQLSSCFILC